jgi:hypothetical protein
MPLKSIFIGEPLLEGGIGRSGDRRRPRLPHDHNYTAIWPNLHACHIFTRGLRGLDGPGHVALAEDFGAAGHDYFLSVGLMSDSANSFFLPAIADTNGWPSIPLMGAQRVHEQRALDA